MALTAENSSHRTRICRIYFKCCFKYLSREVLDRWQLNVGFHGGIRQILPSSTDACYPTSWIEGKNMLQVCSTSEIVWGSHKGDDGYVEVTRASKPLVPSQEAVTCPTSQVDRTRHPGWQTSNTSLPRMIASSRQALEKTVIRGKRLGFRL